MKHAKVSTRLIALVGVLAIMLMAIGAVGLYGIDKSNDALQSVYADRAVPAVQLGDIRARQLDNLVALEGALRTPSAQNITEQVARVESNLGSIGQTWKLYMATYLTPEEAQLARNFAEMRAVFEQQVLRPLLAALHANDVPAADRLLSGSAVSQHVALEKGIEALLELQVRVAAQEYAEAEARYEVIHIAAITIVVASVLFAGVFGFVISRSIRRELGAEPGEAAAVARSVAQGNLTTEIRLHQGDSSSLMAQLWVMQDSLANVVRQVRQGSESVAQASAEIAQGNYDLSSRTEEQASALEETAASMEELSTTVRHNADNARQGNALALTASDVAAKGGAAVGHVVETMKNINDSSRRIADIIGVIDGIAFQTNILALNAAVEAARAGKQGSGFAVVASEVRNLAGRSADAARQIKELIVTSVERVERGTLQVGEAGATMAEVVDSIRRVTAIMGEISTASTQQSEGVAQVGEAMTAMDQATQQNAALVEQSAAASEGLKNQAAQLVQSVAVFTLGPQLAEPDARNSVVDSAHPVAERRSPNRAKNVLRIDPPHARRPVDATAAHA